MCYLTIFTPTYNRAHTLERLYQSLKNQTTHQFEWLVIDDGSTDNTQGVIAKFIEENVIKIRYIKQENSGKQAAWNHAVMLAKGDLFCGVDSDDALYSNDSVEKVFTEYLDYLTDESVIGLRFQAYSNIKNKSDGKELSNDIVVCSYIDELLDKEKQGERIDVLKTSIIKKYLYPIKNDVKFIPELWFYVATINYKFIYIPKPLRLFYDEIAINRLSRSSIKKYAKGHYIARSCLLKNISLCQLLKNKYLLIASIIRFSQCANYLKIPFEKRKQDVGMVYTILSYLLFFMVWMLK